MEVRLIANTALTDSYIDGVLGYAGALIPADSPTPAATVVEFAGRTCYKSYDKPNPATRENADYIRHIITQGHHSVLEHASATLFVSGVSRAFLAEITRHRHLSYSVESQRFVSPEVDPVIPPAFTCDEEAVRVLVDWYEDALLRYGRLGQVLARRGLSAKQAREAARAFLPQMTPVSLVVTGNLRAWRDLLTRRLDPAADAEMRVFAREALEALRPVCEPAFEDIREKYPVTP